MSLDPTDGSFVMFLVLPMESRLPLEGLCQFAAGLMMPVSIEYPRRNGRKIGHYLVSDSRMRDRTFLTSAKAGKLNTKIPTSLSDLKSW